MRRLVPSWLWVPRPKVLSVAPGSSTYDLTAQQTAPGPATQGACFAPGQCCSLDPAASLEGKHVPSHGNVSAVYYQEKKRPQNN